MGDSPHEKQPHEDVSLPNGDSLFVRLVTIGILDRWSNNGYLLLDP